MQTDQFGFKYCHFQANDGVEVLHEGGFGDGWWKYANAMHVYVENDEEEQIVVPDDEHYAATKVAAGLFREIAKLSAVSKEMRANASGALSAFKTLRTKMRSQDGHIHMWRTGGKPSVAREIEEATIDSVDYKEEIALPDGDFTFALIEQQELVETNIRGFDLENARRFYTRYATVGIQYADSAEDKWRNFEYAIDGYEFLENQKRPDAKVVYLRKQGLSLKQFEVEYWGHEAALTKAEVLEHLEAAASVE